MFTRFCTKLQRSEKHPPDSNPIQEIVNMSAKCVEIELPFGEKSFHCPVCGTAIIDVENAVLDGQCPHLLFYRNDDAGVFDRVSPRIQPVLDELEEVEDWKEWAGFLPPTAVVFCFIEPGRGGGHTGGCNFYCIDFASPDD